MIYEFGTFRYDTAQRLLFRGEELVPVVPKAIDTLHVLLERRGQVVDKAELMRLVWPDTTVEDVGLARNISLLRKALGEDAGEESGFIETIPRRGYRFVAAVQAVVPESPALPVPSPAAESPALVETGTPAPVEPAAARPFHPKPWMLWTALGLLAAGFIYYQFYVPSRFVTAGARKSASLALVPLVCLTPDADKFVAGLNEVLVADLAQQPGIQVVSPSTVRRYQDSRIGPPVMARVLGLEVLVEGTVQRIDEHYRVIARLVDVHTGRVIWSDTYDGPAADPGTAQATIGRSIASAVGRSLPPNR